MIRSLILTTTARLLMPLMLIFSVFLLLRGHNAPGGGFVGGLVAASAVILLAAAEGVGVARRALLLDEKAFIAVGLALALGSALLGLLRGQPFMTSQWLAQPLPVLGKLGTPVLFDIGVYFAVFGVALTILFALIEE